jgi:hypothetical protein
MKARTAVAMTTHSNLEVKRTVDTIFLCPEDGRKMLRHDGAAIGYLSELPENQPLTEKKRGKTPQLGNRRILDKKAAVKAENGSEEDARIMTKAARVCQTREPGGRRSLKEKGRCE